MLKPRQGPLIRLSEEYVNVFPIFKLLPKGNNEHGRRLKLKTFTTGIGDFFRGADCRQNEQTPNLVLKNFLT